MKQKARHRKHQTRRDRKARKALKRKRQKCDYQPWPRYLLFAYHHEYDLQSPTSLAASAYESVRFGEWRVLAQDPSGPSGFCAVSVEQRVETEGGGSVHGWLLGGNGLLRQHDPNRYAGFKLVAHSVRRPEGELVEVTSGLEGAFFCPDESIAEIASQSVQFLYNANVPSAYLNFAGSHHRCKLLSTDGTTCRDLGLVEPAFTYKLVDTDLDKPESLSTAKEEMEYDMLSG